MSVAESHDILYSKKSYLDALRYFAQKKMVRLRSRSDPKIMRSLCARDFKKKKLFFGSQFWEMYRYEEKMYK
jgi:hypothetical protein